MHILGTRSRPTQRGHFPPDFELERALFSFVNILLRASSAECAAWPPSRWPSATRPLRPSATPSTIVRGLSSSGETTATE